MQLHRQEVHLDYFGRIHLCEWC